MIEKDAKQKPKGKRWEQMRESEIRLPNPESVPQPEPLEKREDESVAETAPIDYPQLRILLRDSGREFRTKYYQGECAELLDTTTRTLRGWASKGRVPFHREPGGTPYFTPQDIEDILVASACHGKEAH